MLDPIPAPTVIRHATRPLTDTLHLHTLPLHIHEVLFSFAMYTFIYEAVSPYFSTLLFPTRYSKLPPRTKLQWHMHVTSFVNAILLSMAALYVIFADRDRKGVTWEDRMWGYTGAGGFVQALGAGYFLWDVRVCITNIDSLGILDLIHAVVALSIAILGFVCCCLQPASLGSFPYIKLQANTSAASIWFVLWHTICFG